MVIKWAPLATKSLKDIYYFYLPQTGRPKARSIADELRQETRYLLIFPDILCDLPDIHLDNSGVGHQTKP